MVKVLNLFESWMELVCEAEDLKIEVRSRKTEVGS